MESLHRQGVREDRPEETLTGLASRRVRDAERFKWVPGMLACRWAPGFRDHLLPQVRVEGGVDMTPWDDCVPDMRDAATLGAVEHGLLTPRGWVVYRRLEYDGSLMFRATGPGKNFSTYGVGWCLSLATVLAEAAENSG
jgi:hypothetical protein